MRESLGKLHLLIDCNKAQTAVTNIGMYSHISADTVREQEIHSTDPRDPFLERTCNLWGLVIGTFENSVRHREKTGSFEISSYKCPS